LKDCESIESDLADALLGSIEVGELTAAREHVAVCAVCRDELVNAAGAVAQALLADVDLSVEAPAGLKARLLDRARGTSQQRPGVRYHDGGLLIVRGTSVPWRETGMPGLRWRPLSSGRTDDRTMAVFQLDAGATVPQHRHDGVEELFLLTGTLLVQGVPMNSGDYCRADFGSMHAPITAITDCEFLMSSEPIAFV